MSLGDVVLIKQKRTSIKPLYNPDPYLMVKVNDTQVTIERRGRKLKSLNKIKGVTDNNK